METGVLRPEEPKACKVAVQFFLAKRACLFPHPSKNEKTTVPKECLVLGLITSNYYCCEAFPGECSGKDKLFSGEHIRVASMTSEMINLVLLASLDIEVMF